MHLVQTNKRELMDRLHNTKEFLHKLDIPDELSNDIEVIMAAIDHYPWLVRHASARLLKDKELFLYAIAKNPRLYEVFDKNVLSERDLAIELLERLIGLEGEGERAYDNLMGFIPPDLLSDPEISSRLAVLCWKHYRYLDQAQKDDKDLTLRIVARHRHAPKEIPKHFLSDPDIIHASIAAFPLSIRFFSDEVRANRDIALDAVKRNAGSLKYLSAELRDDYDIVKAAVKKIGLAIQFASPRLRSDPDLVMYAMNRNTRNRTILDKVDPSLLSNKSVIMKAIYGNFEDTARLAEISVLMDPGVLAMIDKRLGKDPFGYYRNHFKKVSLQLKLENRQRYEAFSNEVLKIVARHT